ncbi:MAG: hypothetical protein VX768_06095 [Planctomycetota bacterium]|nr:hypothetical protein [Planctomycetota bacterium]
MLIAAIVLIAFVLLAGIILVLTRSGGTKSGKGHSQDQQDSEFVQRLSYLLKIVIEHSSRDRRESSTREVIRIGEAIHESGGFRYMVKIHSEVARQSSTKVAARLKALWKGIGEWRAA